MEVLILLGFLVGIFWVVPVFAARSIVLRKGYQQGPGIALGLCLGWLGVVIAACLSRKTPLPSMPTPGSTRACPHCAELIQRAASVCRYCNRDVQPAGPVPEPEIWPPPIRQ